MTLRGTAITIGVIGTALAAACSGGSPGPAAPEPGNPGGEDAALVGEFERDPVRTLLRSRMDELLEAVGRPYWPPELRLPDLHPPRPSFHDFGDTVEFVFKVRNDGHADAGPFLLRAEVWLIDAVGNNSGPIEREENWPGVAQGQEGRSDQFLPAGQRLEYDISGMTRPIGLAIVVTADPADAAHPHGSVLEENEGINDNSRIYSDDPRNSALPWVIE